MLTLWSDGWLRSENMDRTYITSLDIPSGFVNNMIAALFISRHSVQIPCFIRITFVQSTVQIMFLFCTVLRSCGLKLNTVRNNWVIILSIASRFIITTLARTRRSNTDGQNKQTPNRRYCPFILKAVISVTPHCLFSSVRHPPASKLPHPVQERT